MQIGITTKDIHERTNSAYWSAVMARGELLQKYGGKPVGVNLPPPPDMDPETREILDNINSTIVFLDPRYWEHLSNSERKCLCDEAKHIGRDYARSKQRIEKNRRLKSRKRTAERDRKYKGLTPAEARVVCEYATTVHDAWTSSNFKDASDHELLIVAKSMLELGDGDFTVKDALDWKANANTGS